MDGNVIFSWNGDPAPRYYVQITRDDESNYPWYTVTRTQYTVEDALLYDSISIKVQVPGDKINDMTYKGTLYIYFIIVKVIELQ